MERCFRPATKGKRFDVLRGDCVVNGIKIVISMIYFKVTVLANPFFRIMKQHLDLVGGKIVAIDCGC